ncbi:rhodanese-like domain-containing protein [Streptomyces sp. NPDC007095]|uniref:rhodanese-like domain-containing protein n=1 Tax=Streptomyces sp. NPDC007095 TaxID=3154482 RepID=UPI0033C1D874
MAREVTQEAFAAGHVPGALLMPLRSAPTQCGELPADRPVYVIRAGGNHSMTVADWMNSRGIDARSAADGTSVRVRGGRPVAAGPIGHAA